MIVLRLGLLSRAAILLLAASSALAQGPELGRNGVFNSASAIPPSLTHNEIARGALVSITGVRLASAGSTTTVNLSGKSGPVALPLESVTATKIQVRIPANAALGVASLTVSVGAFSAPAVAIRIVASQYGLFPNIDNVAPNGGRSANSTAQSAAPGQTVVLSGTGLGNATAPAVFMAGIKAAVVSAHAGKTDEIAIRVPADAPEGCFVPVQVQTSNMVTIAIHRSGGPCASPDALPFLRWPGSRLGFLAAVRTITRNLDQLTDVESDEAGASFARLPPVSAMPPFFVPPPPGQCIARVEAVDDNVRPANPVFDLLLSGAAQGPLAVGPELAINDGQFQQRLRAAVGAPGVYYSKFSAHSAAGKGLPHFLAPGRLEISGRGSDAGPFRVALSGPEAFAVPNPSSLIDRASGATLHWNGMGPDRLAIAVLLFSDPVTFTSGSCFCVAAPGAESITIPAAALAHFPAVSPANGGARASLILLSWPLHPVFFASPGLDHGVAVSAFLRHWEVTLR